MIKLDYQETWYEKAERESFEKERSVAPSPNEVKPLTEAEQLLQAALEKVESQSIRQWVTSEHNRSIWLEIAQQAVSKQNGSPDIFLFSALIVATAIGL